MADLSSTKVFGKLTVIHDAILKANAEITGNVNVTGTINGDGSGLTNVDADTLDGYNSSKGNLSNTVVVRNGNDIRCRLLRPEYTSLNTGSGNVNYFWTSRETGTDDNYLRPTTAAEVKSVLGVDETWSYISANTTLSVNTSYGVDFSANRTLTLPASPSQNDKVFIYSTTGDSTGSVIARNGSTIMGLVENMTIDDSILSLELIYSGTTWRILA